ncbi:MAG: hypothetical protein M1814_005928 [Vezdaea aestivalis]|nr:MAG: hypothetical protein M1814_005928 [Vezdaea aestivalis]
MSSPKRRRTTPPPSSAAAEDPGDTLQGTTPRREARSAPRRASFLSPTKASLERSSLQQSRVSRASRSRSRGREAKDATNTAAEADTARKPTADEEPRRNTMTMEGFADAAAEELDEEGESTLIRSRQSLPDRNIAPRQGRRSFLSGSLAEGLRRPPSPKKAPVAPMGQSTLSSFTRRTREQDAADLPPLTQRGMSSKPPTGLANSPARRPRKSKSLAEQFRSSPLKTPQTLPEHHAAERRPALPTPSSQSQEPAYNRPRRPEDPGLVQKRVRKEELENQLRILKDRLRQTEEEIRQQDATPNAPLGKGVAEKIINLLTPSNPTGQLKVTRRPLNLTAFLPFSARRKPAELISHQQSFTRLVPSHRPIQLADPLPYLRLFTPLTFSSQISLSSSNAPLNIAHTIQVSSPLSLLTAVFTLNVEAVSARAMSLANPSLSSWAKQELDPWIMEHAIKSRDVTAACTAIGSYWALARRRAEFWWWCEGEFEELLPAGESRLTRDFARQSKKGSLEKVRGEEEPSRQELMAHLGRKTCTFESKGVRARVEWGIEIDWAGEARSRPGVVIGVPNTWAKSDERASIDRADIVFQTLANETGIRAATRNLLGHTLTALLRPVATLPAHACLSILHGDPSSPTSLRQALTTPSQPGTILITLGSHTTTKKPLPSVLLPILSALLETIQNLALSPKIVYLSAFGTGTSFAYGGLLMHLLFHRTNLLLVFQEHEDVEKRLGEGNAEGWVVVRAVGMRDGVKGRVIVGDGEGRDAGEWVDRKEVASVLVDAAEGTQWDGRVVVVSQIED